MGTRWLSAILLGGSAFCAFAQQSLQPSAATSKSADATQTEKTKLETVRTTVTVLGAPDPISLGESARSVVVMDTQEHPLAFNNVEDYLRTDSSIQINQRGAGGYPADLSIRGTSFEQTLVLLDGFRVNDPETAHNNLDLPVPLDTMSNIEVLHGAGSTLYGADALGGVADFLTARPAASSLWVSGGAGSFGENQQSFVGNYVRRNWSEQIAGHRDFSSGFMYDRDYRNENLSSESWVNSPLGATDILLGGSDTPFGANNFYGNYPSWERTKGWFASIRQELGAATDAGFAYRRHSDNYVLCRAGYQLHPNDLNLCSPEIATYANNHIDGSWQAILRRKTVWSGSNGLYYGLDFDGDSINSNNLGKHARNWGSGYIDLDARSWKRATLSVGAREEIISGGYDVFSPGVAASYWIRPALKTRASVGYGFRLPTYTDLYYSDPTTVGNSHLKPESTWDYEGGFDWYPRSSLSASATGFYSPQTNFIDYVRTSPKALWHATNLNGFSFAGTEASLNWQAGHGQQLNLAWTWLLGAQSVLNGLQSEYLFNYPINNAVFNWYATVGGWAMVNTRVGVQQRFQQTAYPVWDVSVVHEHGRIQPFLQMTNLSNTGYDEIPGVPMPGRAFLGGIKIWVFGPHSIAPLRQ
ncbi:MAG: TonB-dependent receptor plug domain-containing protein [Acidobacteriaceae bacterium]